MPEDILDVATVWFESWHATGISANIRPTCLDYRKRIAEEGEGWTIHVALSGIRICGFVAFEESSHWVRQLFVSPASQGMGFGYSLLKVAEQAMPQGFWLRTDAVNDAARRFYERTGMVLKDTGIHPIRGHAIATYSWLPSAGGAADAVPCG